MLRKLMSSEMPRAVRLGINKGKKQSFIPRHRRGMALPARKELQTNYTEKSKTQTITAKCSTYDDVVCYYAYL